jgi:hypothetical protein
VDLLATDGATLRLWHNDGAAGFAQVTDQPDHDGYHCALAELDDVATPNAPNALDALCAHDAGNGSQPAALYRNLGDGTFAAPVDIVEAQRMQRFSVADVDDDGDIDALAAGPDGVALLRNDAGALSFTALPGYAQAFSSIAALADADADGDLDLAVFDFNDSSVHVGIDIDGPVTRSQLGFLNGNAQFVDINADGRADVTSAATAVTIALAPALEERPAFSCTPASNRAFVVDVDANGATDLVTVDSVATVVRVRRAVP